MAAPSEDVCDAARVNRPPNRLGDPITDGDRQARRGAGLVDLTGPGTPGDGVCASARTVRPLLTLRAAQLSKKLMFSPHIMSRYNRVEH
eukprot:490076-Hanusia_phi.AAC.1